MKTNKLLALSLGLAFTLGGAAVEAKGDKTVMRCRADTGDGIASMQARYVVIENRRTRERFKASFEIAPGMGLDGDEPLEEGDVLPVLVKGQEVGEITLSVKLNGDLGGELDFDTKVDRDAPDDTVPFPANWPGVRQGSRVEIGGLGCNLQQRPR